MEAQRAAVRNDRIMPDRRASSPGSLRCVVWLRAHRHVEHKSRTSALLRLQIYFCLATNDARGMNVISQSQKAASLCAETNNVVRRKPALSLPSRLAPWAGFRQRCRSSIKIDTWNPRSKSALSGSAANLVRLNNGLARTAG